MNGVSVQAKAAGATGNQVWTGRAVNSALNLHAMAPGERLGTTSARQRALQSNSSQLRAMKYILEHSASDREEPGTGWSERLAVARELLDADKICQAESMLLEALRYCEQSPDCRRGHAMTSNALANFYFGQGRLALAEFYADCAVRELGRPEADDEAELLADSYSTLAGAYYSQRRFAEAELPGTRALVIYNKLKGSDSLAVGVAANNLARVYHTQGKWELAESLYERALPILNSELPPGHSDTADLIVNYANVVMAKESSVCRSTRTH